MIRTFRAFFLSRVLREKLLLVGFLGVAVIMWASSFSSRVGQFWRAQHNTTVTLKDQDAWLARSSQIDEATKKAASRMDPAKTLDPTNLAVVVRDLASQAGLKNIVTGVPRVDIASGQFSINRLPLTINNADWSAFSKFYQQLQERAPYVAITELAMTPVRANPAQVIVRMTVASFEIRR